MNFIFSQQCILCFSKSTSLLCNFCKEQLPLNNNSCELCAKPLAFDSTSKICGECLRKKPIFNKVYAPFLYQQPFINFISQLKFNKRLIYANLLSSLIESYIIRFNLFDADVVIPIPLHKKRLRQRGFNQSIEIIKPLAKKYNIPINLTHYHRIKNTRPQSSLKANQRADNMKHAFSTMTKISVKNVLIFDDVITTGNTINEFCKLLKRNGSETINIFCIAHAIPKN